MNGNPYVYQGFLDVKGEKTPYNLDIRSIDPRVREYGKYAIRQGDPDLSKNIVLNEILRQNPDIVYRAKGIDRIEEPAYVTNAVMGGIGVGTLGGAGGLAAGAFSSNPGTTKYGLIGAGIGAGAGALLGLSAASKQKKNRETLQQFQQALIQEKLNQNNRQMIEDFSVLQTSKGKMNAKNKRMNKTAFV